MAGQLLRPDILGKLATFGFKKMRNYRKRRLELLGHYVGRFYGKAPSKDAQAFPLNLIHQATTTMVPNLVYADPRGKVDSRFLDYRPYAQIAELALDHLVREIAVRKTMRRVVTDSIFLAGFMKVGLAVSGQTLDLDGILTDIGQPYADRVDPDDMVLDPVARQWEEQRFIGNRYRADLETLRDSGMFNNEVLDRLSSRYQDSGANVPAASRLGGGDNPFDLQQADQAVETIDLVEMWVPEENVIVTMPWSSNDEVVPEILRVVDYEGPEAGPYQMLGYAFVPDNILPVAPAMIWYDLHIMANTVARKAGEQAARQKSLLAYESSAWQDAQEIVDAMDGEAIRVDQIDAIKEVSYGGVDDDAYKYIQWAKNQFSEMAMNIDLLSGVGSNEATATQAEMVQANTSVRLGDMQSLVYDFTGEVLTHLFYYLHHDPLIELPLVKRERGVDAQVNYTPEMREGDWMDYVISVRPYSMARQDPNLKVRRLMEVLGNIIPAVAQAFQMMGPAFNPEAALNLMFREMGFEEGDEIINSQVLHTMTQQMRNLLEAGVPVTPKVIQTMMTGMAPGGEGGPAGGARPQQPNPRAALPGGITPGVESNQMAQDTAAELQSGLGM